MRDVPSCASRSLVARDAELFFHQEGSSPCLAGLAAVEGIWLEDLDGRRYVDLHGNTAHHLGYRHPRLVAALRDQLEGLTFSPRRFANENAARLAEALLRHWPGPRAKVLFATGGSDAIEIALRLALVATGRQEIIALEGSYHGHGFGALGLASARVDPRLAWTQPSRHHVTPYWAPGGAERMLEEIERILARSGGGVAALVAEPIRSNCHVPPDRLWPELRVLCTRHGVKLIFDEIPAGLGKTGRFFAFEHFGAVPDAVVLGKALGGGMLPIAAVIADARLDVAPELNLGHYTHEKNPITTRVALETIAVIEDDGLAARAARLGAYARQAVETLACHNERIRRWRGRGLLGAIELGHGIDAAAAMRACFRHGVSTVTKPGNALGFSPPLIIDESDIDLTIERIDRAVRTP
ncbi:MAG: aminotransferase class III-fold pyridoxal phosphate-dependent enzyme [Alphaproteobacteria bacterium]|nr:aminotransferase class III-fold pyridoxal phosphate-dependent enzyme [Alphaproteobacteria bacterium]